MLRRTTFLNTDREMPLLGLGVYKATAPGEVEQAIQWAVQAGYRLIDTASVYKNEDGVGRGIASCSIPRSELFITTKVWITNGGYEKAKESLEESLRKLQTGYIDLVLIHQPFNEYYGTYRAMEEAYKEGWIR